jgi:hypothetical protein
MPKIRCSAELWGYVQHRAALAAFRAQTIDLPEARDLSTGSASVRRVAIIDTVSTYNHPTSPGTLFRECGGL